MTSTGAFAHHPVVITDIPPVQSLVARLMQGVGVPGLLMDGTVSSHDFSLRPSQARALTEADLVIWMGPELTPGLAKAVTVLAEDAEILELMALDGVVTYPNRDTISAGAAHDHQAADDDHHERAVSAHHGLDPHGWLDVENAIVWTVRIADHLAMANPGHAALYQANAEAGVRELEALRSEISGMLRSETPLEFVVFHDAYQYFERAHGLEPLGTISLSHAQAPSAARLDEIRDRVAALGEVCVFSEPQFDSRIVASVTENTPAITAMIDPLGASLEVGPDLYPALMRGIADRFATCR
ncbi:zinc ABC transporter substrate-binding protein [Rhodophyticola sp. CCM32]|uniref:zinc ABC transporter substrate-binding protein n=1 Tax=Rhodophyticola sp. CCM32 TaxID=2916397 RepID=UPI001EE51FAD|nr:zinc ABC transporter substrate-binding protein [Rhodophyticola sp. CCM32]